MRRMAYLGYTLILASLATSSSTNIWLDPCQNIGGRLAIPERGKFLFNIRGQDIYAESKKDAKKIYQRKFGKK